MNSLRNPHVRLAVIPDREKDLRDPKHIAAEQLQKGLAAHKERRKKEQTKVEPAIPLDPLSSDDDCDPPEDYREYGDERRSYANSVGMRLWEKV